MTGSRQVTAQELRERYEAARRFAVSTSTTRTIPEDVWGPEVKLWRRYRNGRESIERLPLWVAQQTLAAIPAWEPDVERAKLLKE